MRKILLAVLSFVFVFAGLTFAGCAAPDITLTGGPSYEDHVYGNGGMVVTKGDYVYFASGYIKSSDLGKGISNIKGTVENGGLYRAKVVEVTTGEGEEAVTTQELQDVQLMVSKIVGFEKAGLYIFKDKIYFASPTIERDSTGVRYDLITFFYCNLDGSGLTQLYQTSEFTTSGTFSMTMINEEVYLLVYTGSSVIKVKANGASEVVAEEVTSVVFPVRKNILNNEENPTTNECFIYYTIDKKSDSGINLGNILYKKDIATNEESKLYDVNKISIKLLSIEADRLFYVRNNLSDTSNQSYYSNSLNAVNFESSETRHTMNTYTDFVALGTKNGVNLGIAFIFNSTLYVRGIDQGIEGATEIVPAADILWAESGYIYYVRSSEIFRVDVTASSPTAQKMSEDLQILTTAVDIDLNFGYFFVKNSNAATGYSMYRIALDGLASGNSEAKRID